MQIGFFQLSMHDVCQEKERQIRAYVKQLPEGDFESADRESLAELVAAKFQFPDIPEFGTEAPECDEPSFTQGSNKASVAVYIPFKGDASLFGLYNSTRPRSPPPPTYLLEGSMLKRIYTIEKSRIDTLAKEVEEEIKWVQQYIVPVRNGQPLFNTQLREVAKEAVQHRISEIGENKLAASRLSQSKLQLRKRQDGAEKVIVPVHTKPLKIIPPAKSDPVLEYVLGMAEYDDILSTISSMAKVMERTPEVFAPMNEEPLRVVLLVALNGIYEGQATGETFNGHGKTDILIRREDRNVFIAECLMWKGPAYLQQKMDEQLFQYAMWRDSKLALIVFNRDGNFSHVIDKMKATVNGHPQCIKELDWKHESGARYLFRRHDDSARNFLLTAIAFDVPALPQA